MNPVPLAGKGRRSTHMTDTRLPLLVLLSAAVLACHSQQEINGGEERMEVVSDDRPSGLTEDPTDPVDLAADESQPAPEPTEATEPLDAAGVDPVLTVASEPVALPPEVLAVSTVTRTAEHSRMEASIGSFEVTGTFYPRPGAQARPVEGQLETHWMDDCSSLESEFFGSLWGEEFAFISILAFDPLLGCWVESWWTESGELIRPLAHGYEQDNGSVVTVRREEGRDVRDEIHLGTNQITRRIWRTTSEGVEYLSLELTGQRVD